MSDQLKNVRRPRRTRVWLLLVVFGIAAFAFAILQPSKLPDPLYKGKRVSRWITLAARAHDPQARLTVVEMGALAVPQLTAMLDDKSHHLTGRTLESLRQKLPERWQWSEPVNCVMKHDAARWLLGQMGEAARPMVPAIVRCFQDCPNAHFVQGLDMIDCLGDLGPTAKAALPFLRQLSQETNSSYQSAAAVAAYNIDRDEQRLSDFFCDFASSKPAEFVTCRELFWFRDNHQLNRRLAPIIAKLLFDPPLDNSTLDSVIFELKSRGTDSAIALPNLTVRYLTSASTPLRFEILDAVPWILGIATEKPDVPGALAENDENQSPPETTAADDLR